jgi:nitrite reductase (NO-forming)
MRKKWLALCWVAFGVSGFANAETSGHDHAMAGASAESKPTVGISADQKGMEVVTQTLVQPPFVPLHEQSVGKTKPKIVHVDLSIEEKKFVIAPAKDGKPAVETWGMFYRATNPDYVSTNPGPTIVVHQNDVVEVHLINPTGNLFAHNIDFHGATGAMGGGSISLVSPGEDVTFRFLATKSGVFIYHCAPGGLHIPSHVVSGQSGVLVVLPRNGLKDQRGKRITYDRMYILSEQDVYVPTTVAANIAQHEAAIQPIMKTLTPTYIVMNGSIDALTGDHALRAKVGEKIVFVHAAANMSTDGHLIGGHADLFWPGGSFANTPEIDLESWNVPAGDAIAMLYEFREPGKYMFVNHNLIKAVLFGAKAEVVVEGKWNSDLMSIVNPAAQIK